MSQENNNSNQWPKAFVAVIGTVAISTAAYLMKDAVIMWSMFTLLFIVGLFD